MKRILLLATILLLLILCLVGCGKKKQPTLVYMVDGETYYTDVLEDKDDFFERIGMEPEKTGFLFGGWYFDEGVWAEPLSYANLNLSPEKKEYRVYAKWETVDLQYLEEERAYTVAGVLNGAGSEIVIPSTYKDMPVISIAPEAFENHRELTSVVLPDTLLEIGDYAFRNCTGIERIVIPNKVTTIGRGAFANCVSMTELKLGVLVSEIKSEAFFNCTSLTEVTLPASMKKIGAHAFASSSSLASVSLTFGIRTIGNEAFAGCPVTELSYAATKDDFKRIAQENFAKNSAIVSVKCLDGVLNITK